MPEFKNITLTLSEYKKFQANNHESIVEYKTTHALDKIAERIDWKCESVKDVTNIKKEKEKNDEERIDFSHLYLIKSSQYGCLYEIKFNENDSIKKGDTVALFEIMKMSIAITSPVNGTIVKILAKQGQMINIGQLLMAIKLD